MKTIKTLAAATVLSALSFGAFAAQPSYNTASQTTPDIRLLPMNPSFSPIVLRGEEELEIFGVVTFIIYAAA